MDMNLSKISTNPAIALGVSETTLFELTSAYGFLNDGIKVSPYGLKKLSLETGVGANNSLTRK